MPESRFILNAFQSVRPRGVDMPSAVPMRKGSGKPPLPLQGSRPIRPTRPTTPPARSAAPLG